MSVKERGIIMAAWTTLAILADQKDQTRRICKQASRHDIDLSKCPYGKPGDRLWVRETWQAWQQTNYEYDEHEAITRAVRGGLSWAEWVAENGRPHVEYRADSKSKGPWTPAIHMPRWASRLTLEITDVRIEKLQYISEDDAKSEGVARKVSGCTHGWVGCDKAGCLGSTYRAAFRDAWNDIHGHESWPANPWVWAISFERIRP